MSEMERRDIEMRERGRDMRERGRGWWHRDERDESAGGDREMREREREG